MQVTEQEIEFIRADIRSMGIKLDSIEDSILDHICCAIEAHPGSDFNSVYAEVKQSFGEHELLNIQKQVISISKKNKEKMKKTMYFIGFVATFLTTTGMLFNFMHWKGAAIILVSGVILINLGFLPMYFYDRYKKSVSGNS